jgi:hypothetical protein
METINKKQLIEAMNEISLKNESISAYGDGFEKAMSLVIKSINKIKPCNQFISVHEALPKIGERVLVRTDYDGLDVCRMRIDDNDRITWVNCLRPIHSNGGVIEWCYLPTTLKP